MNTNRRSSQVEAISKLSRMRFHLFERVLNGFAPHVLRLERAMGKFSPEVTKLAPDATRAQTFPDVGIMSIPVPLNGKDVTEMEGTFAIWTIPGELRAGLLLPSAVEEKLWEDVKQAEDARRQETLREALAVAWAGGAGALPFDPIYCVQEKSYGGAVLYDWRFHGEWFCFQTLMAACSGGDAEEVWMDALEARIRHVWFGAARILVRGGVTNDVLQAVGNDEWILRVSGEGQPDVVFDVTERMGIKVKHAVPSEPHRWTYMVRATTDPSKIGTLLGYGYNAAANKLDAVEEITLRRRR